MVMGFLVKSRSRFPCFKSILFKIVFVTVFYILLQKGDSFAERKDKVSLRKRRAVPTQVMFAF